MSFLAVFKAWYSTVQYRGLKPIIYQKSHCASAAKYKDRDYKLSNVLFLFIFYLLQKTQKSAVCRPNEK